MTRNKWAVLGLSALALLAMSAFVVNGAQGNSTEPEFTCLENHTTHVACSVTAERKKVHREHDEQFQEDHTFEAGFAVLTCEAVISHSEDDNGTDPTPTIENTYENCTANPGGTTAHVNLNSCGFELHPEKTSTKTTSEDEYEGTASIYCTKEGDSITIDITDAHDPEEGKTKCLIHIDPQKEISPIYFRNMTSADPTDMTIEASTAEVSARFTGGFLNCGVFGEQATTFYTGNTTAIARNSKGEEIDLELD